MRGEQKGLLTIICGGMLLSWIYAWAAFIMPILGYRPFSIPDGALILALATTITLLHQGRGWRTVSVIGIQAIGFALAACRMVYIHFEWVHSFWSMDWLAMFLTRQRSLPEWMADVLIIIWAAVLWIGGVRLGRRAPDRLAICARFDLGAAAFLSLLIIQLIMIGKGVAVTHGAGCEWVFLAFFIFGLLGLGMAGYGDSVGKGYMSACGGAGAALSFVMLVLLFGGGLVILFLPSLMSAAEAGHDVLKAAARPMISVVITILRFIFFSGCRKAPEEYSPARQQGIDAELPVISDSEPGLLHYVVTWGLIGLGGMIALVVFILCAYWLIRWLASRRPVDQEKTSLWHVLLRLMQLFKTFLLSFPAGIIRKKRSRRGGLYLYGLLQRWGAHCGLPRIPNETPLEYGSRLVQRFPALKNDIPLIVDLYNQIVYGVVYPDEKEIVSARHSLKRMRSPRHWPARLKTWFLSPSRGR